MKKVATYEKVIEACQQLEESGEPITVRKVIELAGGSTATVTPLLRQIEEQKRREQELNYSLSEEFRQSLIVEMHRISSSAKSRVEATLNAALDHEKEILAELAAENQKNEDFTVELQVCRQQADLANRDAEKRLAALEQKVEDFQQKYQETLHEKNHLQSTMDQLRAEASELKVLHQQINEHHKITLEENRALTQKVDCLQAQSHQHEKRAELAESKCTYLEERTAELKSEMVTERELRKKAPSNSQ